MAGHELSPHDAPRYEEERRRREACLRRELRLARPAELRRVTA